MGIGLYDGLIEILQKTTILPREVYCQECYNSLTEKGGMVSNDGKIYCRSNKNTEQRESKNDPCYVLAGFKVDSVRFQDRNDVQTSIRKGGIISYNNPTLEDRAA